ncbi:MAG: putative periplasmic glucans biosynthesis signal peptide protein [Rhodocyclales bacterium]|nr:putative periplasmic glucans biosynthesis signal peptide protein [Rhodocyclales bacterium]
MLVMPAMAHAFDFDDVAARAQRLAGSAYRSGDAKVPAELKQLTYDQYRDIRFKPENALWRDKSLPFQLMFFHLGKFFSEPVRVSEIDGKSVRPISFDRRAFDYGPLTNLNPRKWGDIGFAGFRVHYALNRADYKDEVAVFLGASYFRALGSGQRYGLSARGLAIDTVGGQGEEFPRFTEYWIERPAIDATSLTLYALLDSPRASGAYRIVIHPGSETVMDVQARLFLRASPANPVATLGIAPLTSMYFYGENHPMSQPMSQPGSGNFRPEVHDSDGLSLQTGDGEWIWRPLINPKNPLTTSFSMNELRGFGLMQRDRNFGSYEDLEARYDLRPSAWVEPVGNWGPGRVELLQLPTSDETNDNIVAYWVPQKLPAIGKALDLAWRVRMQSAADKRPPNGWTVQSRRGQGFVGLKDDEEKFVIDFAGPALAGLAPGAPVEAVVSAVSNALVAERTVFRNDVTGGWRLALRVQRIDPARPVEMRAFLKHRNDTLTETWSCIIPPR